MYTHTNWILVAQSFVLSSSYIERYGYFVCRLNTNTERTTVILSNVHSERNSLFTARGFGKKLQDLDSQPPPCTTDFSRNVRRSKYETLSNERQHFLLTLANTATESFSPPYFSRARRVTEKWCQGCVRYYSTWQLYKCYRSRIYEWNKLLSEC